MIQLRRIALFFVAAVLLRGGAGPTPEFAAPDFPTTDFTSPAERGTNQCGELGTSKFARCDRPEAGASPRGAKALDSMGALGRWTATFATDLSQRIGAYCLLGFQGRTQCRGTIRNMEVSSTSLSRLVGAVARRW